MKIAKKEIGMKKQMWQKILIQVNKYTLEGDLCVMCESNLLICKKYTVYITRFLWPMRFGWFKCVFVLFIHAFIKK
jgi:hypothetical protein